MIESLEELRLWVAGRRKTVSVSIKPCELYDIKDWAFGDNIAHKSGKFFQIQGFQGLIEGTQFKKKFDLPLIVQPEIGVLGILQAYVERKRYFLLQTKIEPGNIGIVQISPTLQATRSNILRAHGGKRPKFLDKFSDETFGEVLFDQILTEQGERFLSKHNRNIVKNCEIFCVDDEDFTWVSETALRDAIQMDNLVNMDTRSVYCAINLAKHRHIAKKKSSQVQSVENVMHKIVSSRSNFVKYIKSVPLSELMEWKIESLAITSENHDFQVSAYNIEIENRETKSWSQPMIKAVRGYRYSLLVNSQRGKETRVLCELSVQPGNLMNVELGPSLSNAPFFGADKDQRIVNELCSYVETCRTSHENVIAVYQSEEGGRFFHDSNLNEIIHVDNETYEKFLNIDGFIWISLNNLNKLIHSGPYLNVELRSLISML